MYPIEESDNTDTKSDIDNPVICDILDNSYFSDAYSALYPYNYSVPSKRFIVIYFDRKFPFLHFHRQHNKFH